MSGTAGDVSFSRGENPLRADKLNAAFAERVLASGDQMLGPLLLSRDPQLPFEAASKQYVDGRFATTNLTSPIRLWGNSSTINDYDAQISATGGATVPGNPGQGELNYLAGRHVFQGYDGTTNFRVGNTPWAYEWWEAIGSAPGVGATLRAGTDLATDCSGVIVAQGSGTLTFGNGEGTFLTMPAINKQIINYVQLTPGGFNESVGLRAAGGDGLVCNFSLSGNNGGGVSLANGNGTIASFSDPAAAPGVARNCYWTFAAGNASTTPVLALSTSGIPSPPASVTLTINTVGAGGMILGNATGRLYTAADGGGNGVASFRTTTPSAAGQPLIVSASAGTSTDVDLQLTAAGVGSVTLGAASGGNQMRILNQATATRTVDIKGAVTGGSPVIKASAGNLFLGQSGLASTATDGYIQIPTTTAPPTGVPTNGAAGATLVVDAANNKLWVYISGNWKSVALT